MEALGLVLASIAALAGFPAGILLGRIAKEEMKAGAGYFRALQAILLAAILFSVLYLIKFGYQDSLFIIIASLVFLFGLPAGSLFYLRKL